MTKNPLKELKAEIRDANIHDEVMDCCDKAFSEGYIRGLEVGMCYLKEQIKLTTK